MVSIDLLQKDECFLVYPYEEVRHRWEKATRRVFERWRNEPEREVDFARSLFHDALRAGQEISREEYYA